AVRPAGVWWFAELVGTYATPLNIVRDSAVAAFTGMRVARWQSCVFGKAATNAAGLNRWRISDRHGTSPSFVKLNTQDRVAVSLLTTLLITHHSPCTLNNAIF